MAINLLALHPEVQEKARAEVQQVLGDRTVPTYEDQKQFEYLGMLLLLLLQPPRVHSLAHSHTVGRSTGNVIKETLRLWPPVSVLPARELQEPMQVLGYDLPRGTSISIPVYTIQRDARYWPDPNTFNPDRFSANHKHHPFAYQPFGHGARACLGSFPSAVQIRSWSRSLAHCLLLSTTGKEFSLQEQRIFLAVLLLRYRLLPGPQTNSPQQRASKRNFDLAVPTFLIPRNLFIRFVPIQQHQQQPHID